VLETRALLDIVPGWQTILTSANIDPLEDLDRVFVASPTLEQSQVVVAARHRGDRARLAAAVAQLASGQGKQAAFHPQQGYEVADWWSPGPTQRVIALTGSDQFTITRAADLGRVLDVAAALARTRREQGFDAAEVERQGGLLAMQGKEAVALWVEGVHKYVPPDSGTEAVPESLRLSLYHVDQFNTELRVRGQYGSKAAAHAAER
jgi:hypothetical protein